MTRTWWFWAGVGALVGVTTAVAIAASGTDPPPPSTTGQVLGAVRTP